MAKTLQPLFLFTILSSFLINSAKSHSFSTEWPSSATQKQFKREKLSHLHFYFHDIVSGRNPSAVRIAEAPITNKSSSGFGLLAMIDDPLTTRPELSSKVVGRAQGIYGSASQSEIALLLVSNFVFLEGKYNGSTISVLGRNSVLDTVREMPIISGSGLFRFARGYAQARTHTFDLETGDAVVEYNVYVLHY